MPTTQDFPEIAFVRVLTAGGPYPAGATLSVAFVTPGVGRLAAHDSDVHGSASNDRALVPETISARVVRAAGPYRVGESLALSFVDPAIARIHVTSAPIDGGDRTMPSGGSLVRDRRSSDAPLPAVVPAAAAPAASVSGGAMPATPAVHQSAAAQHATSTVPGSAPPARTIGLPPRPTAADANAVPRSPLGVQQSAAPASAPKASEPRANGTLPLSITLSPPIASQDGGSPSGTKAEREPVKFTAPFGSPTPPDAGSPKTASVEPTGPSAKPAAVSPIANVDITISPETIAAIVRPGTPAGGVRAAASRQRAGVRVRLDWNRDRVRRFVQVVDKLFTIDRLGWYRHVFAMRLLVPDLVVCGDATTDVEALRHLHSLRAASIETLGRPLLAAFMPSFSVTPEWLDSLDKPGAARALSGLRESLMPLATEETLGVDECEAGWTVSAIKRSELAAVSATSVESLLPLFVPTVSTNDTLTEKLTAYRAALVDIFGQTVQSADAVRLNLMAQPNHTLDDRLGQLARAVNETFGGLAVA